MRVKKTSPLRITDPRISPDNIDPDALKVIRRLQEHGYAAYVVGGAVRDQLLGIPPKDCDVVTSAKPNEIRNLFRNAFIIGRRFKLVHVRFRMNKVIETATFRKHHGQEDGELVSHDNVFGTEEDDAFRRDFTLNGLFYDPSANQIIDYVGGLKDIEERRIRCLGRPDIRLTEDPVRILRAIKFAAKFNLRMDPALDKSIHRLKGSIKLCSQRRLFEELLKILKIGLFEAFVKKADEYEFLGDYLPFFNEYRQKNKDQALQLARACDHYSVQKPNEPHFIFALLVWPKVRERNNTCHDIHQAMHHVFAEFNNTLPLSRLDKVRIRMIIGLLPKFEYLRTLNSKKRRGLVRNFLRSPGFREALELYRAIETIEQGDTPGFRYWSEILNRPIPQNHTQGVSHPPIPSQPPRHIPDSTAPIIRRRLSPSDDAE